MMLECSTGELLARAAFMHHDDQRYDALRHHAVLKGLTGTMLTTETPSVMFHTHIAWLNITGVSFHIARLDVLPTQLKMLHYYNMR